MSDFFNNFGSSFLGLHVLRLYQLIDDGGTKSLQDAHIDLPSKLASIMVYLQHNGSANVTDISKVLNLSHQLISQRLSFLLKENLIVKEASCNDLRKSNFQLTDKGHEIAKKISEVCLIGDEAYKKLNEELGINLLEVLIKASDALKINSLNHRISIIKDQKHVR